MSMIRPMIRSMRRPIIRGIIRTPSIVSRILMSFDATAFTHLVYAKPVVLANDWRISANYATTSSADIAVFGDTGGSDELRLKFSTGEVLLIVDGDFNSWPGVLTGRNDGEFRKAEVFHFGLDLLLYLDDVFAGTQSTANTLTIDRAGQSGTGARYFDGELANLQLEDITNAIPLTFRVDEATANFELPVENVFGSELSLQPTVDLDNWGTNDVIEEIVGDEIKFTATSAGSERGFMVITGLTIGDTYIVEVIGRRGVQGTTQEVQLFSFAIPSSLGRAVITSQTEAVYSFVVVADATSAEIRAFATIGGAIGDEILLRSISVKSVTQAITYINAPPTIRFPYEFVDDDASFLGETELVTNGGFDTDTDWTKGTAWTISGGTANSDGGSGRFIVSDSAVIAGNTYRSEFTALNFGGGQITIDTGGVFSIDQTSDGLVTTEGTATGSVVRLFGGLASGYTGSIDNVLVNRLIPIFNAIRYSPLTSSYTSADFTPIIVTNTEIISFHVKGLTTSATIQYLFGGTVESSWIFYQGSTGNLRLVDDAANVTEATFTGLSDGGDYYVEMRLTATGWDLYVDSVFKVSATGTVGNTTLDRLAYGNATSMTLGTIYGVTLGASASWPMQSGFDDQFDDRDMIGTNTLTYTGAPGPITDADTIETENL